MCVASRHGGRGRRHEVRYDWALARAMRAEGRPLRQIALRLGCSYRTVTLARAAGRLG